MIRLMLVFLFAAISACSTSSGGPETALIGYATTSATQDKLQLVSALPTPERADVSISRDDLLEIDVFGVDELDRVVRVDSEGRISLALIGMVEAAGKTTPELQREIGRLYAEEYLRNPEVSVFVKESAGQRVTILGAVAQPGIYPTFSTSTLMQVIAQAGGFNESADEAKVYVFRQVGETKVVANMNMKDIRLGRRQDPQILGGDIVVSFSSGAKIAMKNLRESLGIATSVGRLATF